jgi:hypothetical protein
VPPPAHQPTRGARSRVVRGWRAGAKAHDGAQQGGGGAHDYWRDDPRPAAAEVGPATMADGARKLRARGGALRLHPAAAELRPQPHATHGELRPMFRPARAGL